MYIKNHRLMRYHVYPNNIIFKYTFLLYKIASVTLYIPKEFRWHLIIGTETIESENLGSLGVEWRERTVRCLHVITFSTKVSTI